MTDAVKPCPNPECKSECALFEGYSGWYYACKFSCGYRAPCSESPEESLRLHNLIRTPPAGWKLVPVDPTETMLEAADNASNYEIGYDEFILYYKAMLSAAPENET